MDRFDTDSDPFQYDSSTLATQYSMYKNDTVLDFQYGKDPVKFWMLYFWYHHIQQEQ